MGLQRYDHVPSVRAARLTLVAEAKALMLRDWNYYRRINENYNSITGSGSDNDSAKCKTSSRVLKCYLFHMSPKSIVKN
jgi:hypothetical protein